MRTGKIMSAILTGVLASLSITTALAGTNVLFGGSHRVLSSVDDGNGLNTITLEITLNNTSGIDLNNLSLDLVPDRTIVIVDPTPLTVASLNAGASTTVNWTLHSPMPPDLLDSGIPLTLVGGASDSLGGDVAVSVTNN